MTRMENLQPDLDEQARQDAVYQSAMASIQRSKMEQEKQGYVVMAGFMSYGEGALGDGWFGKVSHAAKLFCIGFAFAVPPLMVALYLL